MSDRDRKIMMVLGPVILLGAFWFLLLSPKRAEVSKLGDDVATAQTARDEAVNKASSLKGSRQNYAKDYATVVRLGKAVPSTIDMPSLLVQLDTAAKGTGIDFKKVATGDRAAASTATAPPSSGSSAPPVAAGGEQAKTGAGQSAEKANNASSQSTTANQAATQQPAASGSSSSSSSGSTTSTTPSTSGSSGTAAAPTDASTSGVAGLDTVPLDFTFTGSYFDLADFFHRMKRFVRVANDDIKVRGRLMTIDNLDFTSSSFPTITATVKATVYLTPKTEGTTAGATPAGPSATPSTPAATTSTTPSAAPASTSSPAAGGQ